MTLHSSSFDLVRSLFRWTGVPTALTVPRLSTLAGGLIGVLVCSSATPGHAQESTAFATAESLPKDSTRSPATQLRFKGDTAVSLAKPLQYLFDHGSVPKSLHELQVLEAQQKKVAAKAIASTVSVRIGQAQGCGAIITPTGYVLTAAHVAMRPGTKATLIMPNGRQVRATTLGMNRGVDAGLIKIDPGQNNNQPWPHATLGKSVGLSPGMWCVACGHPGGYDDSRGIVTRVGRILHIEPTKMVTDCALIGGDSGGPLFDLSGHLIAIHSRIGNDVSDNLHIPIDRYNASWDRLASGESWGYLEGFRPVLGVSGIPNLEVARIARVTKGSPAEKAGIKIEDVISQFGDVTITNFQSLTAAVADTMPGERVEIWLTRQGRHHRVKVEIGRKEDQE